MQYFIYELRNKGVYYFYFNLGISKIQLWVSTRILLLFDGGNKEISKIDELKHWGYVPEKK